VTKQFVQEPPIYGNEEIGFSGSIVYVETEHGRLLPCPFCGSDDLEVCNTHTPSYWIACKSCDAEASGEVAPDYDRHHLAPYLAAHWFGLLTAVKWWNTRGGIAPHESSSLQPCTNEQLERFAAMASAQANATSEVQP
jgi:hypothetical protein